MNRVSSRKGRSRIALVRSVGFGLVLSALGLLAFSFSRAEAKAPSDGAPATLEADAAGPVPPPAPRDAPRRETSTVEARPGTAAAPLPATAAVQADLASGKRFESAAQERSFWQGRLPGERLTLEGLTESEVSLSRMLEAARVEAGPERMALEARRASLRAKLDVQRARVRRIEERIMDLQAALEAH